MSCASPLLFKSLLPAVPFPSAAGVRRAARWLLMLGRSLVTCERPLYAFGGQVGLSILRPLWYLCPNVPRSPRLRLPRSAASARRLSALYRTYSDRRLCKRIWWVDSPPERSQTIFHMPGTDGSPCRHQCLRRIEATWRPRGSSGRFSGVTCVAAILRPAGHRAVAVARTVSMALHGSIVVCSLTFAPRQGLVE